MYTLIKSKNISDTDLIIIKKSPPIHINFKKFFNQKEIKKIKKKLIKNKNLSNNNELFDGISINDFGNHTGSDFGRLLILFEYIYLSFLAEKLKTDSEINLAIKKILKLINLHKIGGFKLCVVEKISYDKNISEEQKEFESIIQYLNKKSILFKNINKLKKYLNMIIVFYADNLNIGH